MIDWLLWVVLALLVGVSFLDIKYKEIPSLLLTGLLFVVAFMRIGNIEYGILAGLFAWVMRDLIFEWNGLDFGIADIKIMAIIGCLVPSLYGFLLFVGIFSIFQFAYVVLWKWKVNKDQEMPFVPLLTFVFVALMLIGGVA